jgi:hypothetical protein
MANYIINECLTNDEYIVSGTPTFSPGQTIRFVFNEQSYCGTVGEVTSSPPSADFGQLYDDCCECLSGLTESLNFSFIRCDTGVEISIDATQFCSENGAPTTGLTYEIQFGDETPFCATFEGLSGSGETNYSYVSGPFSLCEDCNLFIPTSAGTETLICVEICGPSGTTVTQVVPPHPVWTNGYGTQVTQLNMVVLGGPNGLNS